MNVAANVDAVFQAVSQSGERAPDVFDAARVVFGADAVFGYVDRNRDAGMGIPQACLERLGPELITHLREFDSGLGPQVAFLSDAATRVCLHAEKISVAGRFEPRIVNLGAFAVAPA